MSYQRWKIPQAVVADTEHAFRRGQHEVFAIWTASNEATLNVPIDAALLRCVVPHQTPGVTPTGVWVHIAGSELQRIQLDNYRRQERSVVQLHTHPGANVRMSQLDRDWEVVRHVGALSIIVPFYGAGGLRLHDAANVYEREADDWRLWSRSEACERLVVG